MLFDLDDTLCDYAAARALRLRTAFAGADPDQRPVGIDLDRMVADSVAANPHGADHFPALFAAHGLPADRASTAMAWYRANRFHGLALFPEASAVVAAVRALDRPAAPVRIGVVTNGPAEVQRAKARLLGVEALADFVLVSGEFGAAKPEPAIFAEALRLGGVDPARALMVGDSLHHDIAGARAAGIRTIWINRAAVPPGNGTLPDQQAPDLPAALPLIAAWLAAR